MARQQPPNVTVTQEQIVCIRRALANYIHLMHDGALEGQQDPDNDLWTTKYVKQEIARCDALLKNQFRVTW